MNCVVTAGPTYEPLDEVRRLTNFSTGRLGTQLANHLAEAGHEVTLLLSQTATFRAASPRVRVREFTTTQSLFDLLREMGETGPLAGSARGAVFHAAAASDYRVAQIWRRRADGTLEPVSARKIPTRGEPLLAELTPTPKIISHLRAWHPACVLVGWKYELDGTREEALAKGREQIRVCGTDACVVNGAAYGSGFGLVNATGCLPCAGEADLFKALEKLVG